MSKMSELEYEILEMMEKDYSPFSISRILDIPIDWVYQVVGDVLEMEEA